MKGFRFYAEMPDARRSKSASKDCPFQPWTVATMQKYANEGVMVNCIALVLDNQTTMEAVAGIFEHGNSPVTTIRTCQEHLRKRCVRVPEDVARRLHPRLFAYLNDDVAEAVNG